MAKIDYAWSNELEQELTASEAHEKWVIGLISDKTRFECRDPRCNAQITCVNMDKQQYEMKVREHFKVYGIHSCECEEKMNLKYTSKINEHGMSKSAPKIEEEITFDMTRPQNHFESEKKQQNDCEQFKIRELSSKHEKRVVNDSNGNRKSHLFLLSTMVSRYIFACKENKLETTLVNICFDRRKKPYVYMMKSLFVEISYSLCDKNEAWKSKVYIGKAKISKKSDEEFWINFESHFQENDKPVCCVIKKDTIDNTNSKRGAVRILERFLDKDNIYCFAFGKLNITKNIVFINIDSLDHFACTDENIKKTDSTENK